MSLGNSPNWMYSSGGGFYDTEIDGSLLFNDDDTAYLSRTPSTAGNQDTWTWSGWVKRGNINAEVYLWSAGTTTSELFYIQFRSDSQSNNCSVVWRDNSTTTRSLVTNRSFRDTTAWYHVVLQVNTGAASATDRMKLYINGVEETSFSADSRSTLSSSSSMPVNSTMLHTIGRYAYSASGYMDGYIAEVNFIDGQALGPDSFGEFKYGSWKPKSYSGSYGTNGFYLKFDGNTNDSSGNGNNWTANNITSDDYVPDSPTENYAVLAGVQTANNQILSEGNTLCKANSSAWGHRASTVGMKTGKWYAEFKINNLSSNSQPYCMIGIVDSNAVAY